MFQQIWTIIYITVLPLAVLIITTLVLGIIFDTAGNPRLRVRAFRCIVWWLGVVLLAVVTVLVPIILYETVNENAASAGTFIIYLIVGLPLFVWLSRNAAKNTYWMLPDGQPKKQAQQQELNLELPPEVPREVPEVRQYQQRRPVPINPRGRR